MKTDLSKIAKLKGGAFLGKSATYQTTHKYIWQCAKGHTWEARIDSISRGSWCPVCNVERQKNTLEEMHNLAQKKGGECLSKIYVNAHTKLKWICKNGHIFYATPSKIKIGRWCKICGNRSAALSRRLTIKEIQEIAISHNGKCLSKYYDPKEKLEWKCEFGHTWFALVHSVKAGHWCPICGHKKSGRKQLTIGEMKNIAKSHRGKCLSESYTNVDTKLIWMCEKGHVWEAIPSAVKKGHWCPVCAGNQMLTIGHAQELAKSRGGKCISIKFEGVHKKLKWECAEGHNWFAEYSNIYIGRWCPECSMGIGERICRAHFEQLFNKKFPKTRPTWLINNDGNQMELDGYCEELSLAFEHQGLQHIKQIDYFYSSEEQFFKRLADDDRKKNLCQINNVILIEVPQIPDNIPLTEIQQFILDKCRSEGIEIPIGSESIQIDLKDAFSVNNQELLKNIQDLAKEKGGTCLSPIYKGSKGKLNFRCKKGHEWETIPEVIVKGHWCPICGANKRGFNRRLTILEMEIIAKERGGHCLSTDYVNANSLLLWECGKGHQWSAIPNSIKRGSWCPVCAKEKKRKFIS